MMESSMIPLGIPNLGLAAILILLAGGTSVALSLKLERTLLIASVRTVIQLLLVGYVLRFVFELNHLLPLSLVALVMITFAARNVVQRSNRTAPCMVTMAFLTLIVSGLMIALFTSGVVIGAEPWYRPRYLIPFLGMVLGNTLTGLSLCLDYMLEFCATRKDVIEMELSHGATRWEAARTPIREAVRRGMIPIINAMMVVGVVSFPGTMTGQILAGAEPLEAVKYQIVVMFMIAAATSLGCIFMAVLVYRRLFNSRHQLMSGLITKNN